MEGKTMTDPYSPPKVTLFFPGVRTGAAGCGEPLGGKRLGRLLGGARLQGCNQPSPVRSVSDLMPYPDLRVLGCDPGRTKGLPGGEQCPPYLSHTTFQTHQYYFFQMHYPCIDYFKP